MPTIAQDQTAVPLQPAYGRDAAVYDTRTRTFHDYRRMVVDQLPLRPGDTVLDVGCGTGLCFDLIRDRIGPHGRIIGVDASPQMLAVAAERAAAQDTDQDGPDIELIEAPVESAQLPDVDHALFCAVHDVMQSEPALDNVLSHVRDGGSVSAGGGKWAPAWAIALNAGLLALHAPYIRDFTGFDRPWRRLAEHVPDLQVREVAMGGGYLALGQVAGGPPSRDETSSTR